MMLKFYLRLHNTSNFKERFHEKLSLMLFQATVFTFSL